jgi:pentatricopeptide repeat protein
MMLRGVLPNAHSFSAVINAHAKAGDIESAIRWLVKMEAAGIAADVVVYNTVLDACAKAKCKQSAAQVFKRMTANEIRPDVRSYASFARPFAYDGDYQEVERMRTEMQAIGLRMNEYFLYALLVAYASALPRQSQRAEAALRDAVEAGIEISRHVLTALGQAVDRARCQELMAELDIRFPVTSVQGHSARRSSNR